MCRTLLGVLSPDTEYGLTTTGTYYYYCSYHYHYCSYYYYCYDDRIVLFGWRPATGDKKCSRALSVVV